MTVVDFSNVPSPHITPPAHAGTLPKNQELTLTNTWCGRTHGTDTLEETAYFVIPWTYNDIPVVLGRSAREV